MTNNKNDLKEKLKIKLREIFQFENGDLDFSIYKIMNYKRKEIEKFIREGLINEIRKQLVLLSEEGRREMEEKLKEISSKNGVKMYLEALEGGDEERARTYEEYFPKDIEEYKRLKKQLELEKEIYNHLINFFSKYYDKGDFISKRRYEKNEKYIVPYNEEEILFCWTNEDLFNYKLKIGERERKRIAIVWRNMKDIDLERDKEVVEENIKEFEPDEIYINGGAVVRNFKPIEPLFKTLMFEEVR